MAKIKKITKLDENNVYWISKNKGISIHLSNKPTGKRNSAGQLLDNIKNEGWYLFVGTPGKMKKTKKLTKTQAINMINNAWGFK